MLGGQLSPETLGEDPSFPSPAPRSPSNFFPVTASLQSLLHVCVVFSLCVSDLLFFLCRYKSWDLGPIVIQYDIVLTCSVYLIAKACPTLLWPLDCSPPGSSAHGIFRARILQWVAISSSRGFSQPRDWTWVSCIGRWILYSATREARSIYRDPISK